MSRFLTLALTLSFSFAGCADSPSDESAKRVSPVAATAKTAPVQAPVASAELASDELVALVQSIEPQKARNGGLRFSDPALDTPAAAPLLLARLRSGSESESVKEALALALPRTRGDYAAGALELLQTEKSSVMRAALIDAMRLSTDSDSALQALAIGLSDSSADVRSRAAFNLGRRSDGLALADELVHALNDSDALVQSRTARALGQLGSKQGFDEVAALLGSRDADVRLESLRALGRMDAMRASEMAELPTLANDADERIRNAAEKVMRRAY